MTDKKKGKTEEEILFPEVAIGGLVVKPWSFGKLFLISPILEKVLDKVEEKSLDKVFEGGSMEEGGFLSYTNIARIFTVCSTELLELIALTLDVTEDEIKDLSISDGVRIIVVAYNQNSETIKNAVALALVSNETENKKEDVKAT